MDLDPAHWSNRTKIVVAVVGLLAAVLFMYAVSATTAGATYKPEYGQAPQAVQSWFRDAKVNQQARKRLEYEFCCNHADRYKTRFIGGKEDHWAYWDKEVKKFTPISPDIVHYEGIHAKDPKEDNLPEFKQMRVEGVLMRYRDEDGTIKDMCFWPPESGN